MSALAISNFAIGFSKHSGVGLASEHEQLEKLRKEILEEIQKSESIGRNIISEETLSELKQVYRDCSIDNWDGYGANPITENTYLEAESIIEMLNETFLNFPMPEIVPEPGGEIAFEWNDDYGQTFVFSIDDNKTITYAGIFGQNKVHGTERLRGFLPRTIIYNLMRLYP